MKARPLQVAFLTVIAAIAILGALRNPPETVLPNGFVIRGYAEILSPDRRRLLMKHVLFICFDDRFLVATPFGDEDTALFDRQNPGRMDARDHPELVAPGGLLSGRRACNGYHTWMMGPGLLHDGAERPFLPDCRFLNTDNPALADRAWLARPCEERRPVPAPQPPADPAPPESAPSPSPL